MTKQVNPTFKVFRKTGSGSRSTWRYELLKVHTWTDPDYPIIDFDFSLHSIGGCGDLSVTAGRDLGWEYNDRIDIDVFGTKKYSGFVTRVQGGGTGSEYRYEAAGFVEQLSWIYIPEYQITAKGIRAAVVDLISERVVGETDVRLNLSKVDIRLPDLAPWNGIIDNLEFSWVKPTQIIEVLRQMLGEWDYGVDEEMDFFFRRRELAASRRYFVGRGDIHKFEPGENSAKVKNRLHLVVGQLSNGESYIREFDSPDSISRFGRREDRVTLPSAFPLYSEVNRAIGATVTTSGFADFANPEAMVDGDPETYGDSQEPQISGAIIYSRLDSADEIASPQVGPAGEIVGIPDFSSPGRFWPHGMEPGIGVGGGYARFPTPPAGVRMERGAFGVWWRPASDYTGQRVYLMSFLDERATRGGVALYYESGRLVARVKRTDEMDELRFGVLPVHPGEWYHIGFAWDASGDDLARLIGNPHKRALAAWVHSEAGHSVFRGSVRGSFNTCAISPWLSIGHGPNTAAAGILSNAKIYDHPKANYSDCLIPDSGREHQVITLDLGAAYNIGRTAIYSTPPDDDAATPLYARAIEVAAREKEADEWRVAYSGPNSMGDLAVDMKPWPKTRYLRYKLTGSAPEHWHIYELAAHEMELDSLDQWASRWIDDNAKPEEFGSLELAGVDDIPPVGIRLAVHDRNGRPYEYQLARVIYKSDMTRADLDLGEKESNIAPTLRAIYRKIIEVEHTVEGDAKQTSTGIGYAPGSIPSGAIGSITADQIKAGVIRSRNYADNAGLSVNLDSAEIVVNEPGGLAVQSPGGVELTGGGSVVAGAVELDSDGVVTVGTGSDVAVLSAKSDTHRIWAGGKVPASAKFSVAKNGKLEATDAEIAGKVSATAGSIGGWEVTPGSLRSEATGERIELDQANSRIVIYDAAGNPGMVIGYLAGLYRVDVSGDAS